METLIQIGMIHIDEWDAEKRKLLREALICNRNWRFRVGRRHSDMVRLPV